MQSISSSSNSQRYVGMADSTGECCVEPGAVGTREWCYSVQPEVSQVKEAMRRDELGERLQLDFKSELITPPVAHRLEGCFLWCALIRVIPLCRGHETCYSQNGRHHSPCKGCSEPYKNVTISFPYPCSPSYTHTHTHTTTAG